MNSRIVGFPWLAERAKKQQKISSNSVEPGRSTFCRETYATTWIYGLLEGGRVLPWGGRHHVRPPQLRYLVGLVANARLVAVAPGTELVEYTLFENDPVIDADDDPGMYPFELTFDIIKDEPAITNGQLTVPDGPGLGVDVNPTIWSKASTFSSRSDMIPCTGYGRSGFR